MPLTLPPHALPPLCFPFRHLAALASRAPIGGAREVALACFVAARLASDRLAGAPLPDDGLAARGASAKGWLATLALPATVRGPLAHCLDLSATALTPDATLAAQVTTLAEAASEYLDQPGRAELAGLAATLAGSRPLREIES